MVNIPDSSLCFRPPSGFTDSREFSEAECDRELALDLEVQQVMEKGGGPSNGANVIVGNNVSKTSKAGHEDLIAK